MPEDFAADILDREVVAVDDELSAVTPPGGGRLDLLRPSMLRRRPLESLQPLPFHSLQKPFQDQLKPDPAGIEFNRAHAAEVLPFLREAPVQRTWAGLMPFSLDGAPLIGKIPGRDNLYIVGGLASSGFGRGPMAGKLLAEFIHSGQRPHVLSESDPARCVTAMALQ